MTWNTSSYPVIEHFLAGARAEIAARIHPLQQEQVVVADALHRVTSTSLQAAWPKPQYDQSTRDGFALSAVPQTAENGRATFQISGEIAAGSQDTMEVTAGEAIRIMTGAMIPDGCTRVVPFEQCNDYGTTVEVPTAALTDRQSYIRLLGTEVKQGKVLVEPGTRLVPDHLLMLAENGCREVPVYKIPNVAVLCTGSELVNVGETVRAGQKISGNGVLLAALLKSCGAHCFRSETVVDEQEVIEQQAADLLAAGADMVITTGGMGPGKYDLMEQVFASLGGTVVYNRLQVRPGKFTLLGMIGRVPFFALPGPPPAVRTLFHELVVPALHRLQGCLACSGPLVSATLVHTLSVKQTGHLNLKGAVVRLQDGRLQVHPAGRMEPINSIIHLEGSRAAAEYGEQVQVRLLGPLQGLAG